MSKTLTPPQLCVHNYILMVTADAVGLHFPTTFEMCNN